MGLSLLPATGFEMTMEQAAQLLDEKLRGYPWYVSVGVGATTSGPTLFLYVKHSRAAELKQFSSGWYGYPVIIRAVGAVRPASRELSIRPGVDSDSGGWDSSFQ